MDKNTVLLIIAILAPFVYIDKVYLAGENIQNSSLTIKPAYEQPETLDIEIDEPDLPYSLGFALGYGNSKERAEIHLTAPSGKKILNKVEIEKRSGHRHYFFTPDEKGIYKLSITSLSIAPLVRSTLVTVTKNDRRILGRIVAYLAI